MPYAIYRPIFTPLPLDKEGKQFFSVEMKIASLLMAPSPESAMEEAKASYCAPIVGHVEGERCA